jgi:small GTP-binding protein
MIESLQTKDDLSDSDLTTSNIPYTKRKILLQGRQGVGKTALIKRFKNNLFIDDYEPTIQITTKKVISLNNEFIDLEIVDLEGQTEYTIFSPNKFSFGYNGYMLVYDVTQEKSFELIKNIYDKIEYLSGKTSKILIGAKSDNNLDSSINERQVSTKEGEEFAERIHCPFIEISSKDNKNIEEAFRKLLIEINKTESGVNLKALKFRQLFQFFIHHPKMMINCFYINLIFLVLLSLLIIYSGVYTEICENIYYGVGFPCILLGLWEILFNVCGIFGIYYKNTYLLEMNYCGLILGGVYLVLNISQSSIQYFITKDNENYPYQFLYLFLINIIPLIVVIALSIIFKIIYQQDLKSYMA